ncbi:MAG: hypothetical protein A2X36_11560 [Elusimicrobia bacterium GWA2_69_24]|nr:MAG: hypothetical protein A2X36_11560 [Elusimicrobia bacterium GWA2_69_24]
MKRSLIPPSDSPWMPRLAAAAALLCCLASYALARAGGGHSYSGGGFSGGGYSGGGSIHGSGGSGLIELWIWLVMSHPIIGIPATLLLIYFLYAGGGKGRSMYVGHTIVRGAATQVESEKLTRLAKIKERDPAFDENALVRRVINAFLKIQTAWSAQDMSPARAFVSDGVMERFSIQIAMQKARGMRNQMERVEVRDARIAQADSDSHFDTVHFAVRATAVDTDVLLKDGSTVRNSGKTQSEFVEVWSFLRRPGAKTLQKPGLIEGSCPSCGAPLQAMDAAKCGSCGSFVNSGEYDWVLAEITQGEEWTVRPPERTIQGYQALQQRDPAFNIQFMEDRGSVAFWRWQMAAWERKPDLLQALANEECAKAFIAEISQKHVVYKEAAVGGVEVLACENGDPFDRVHVQVRWSGERFEIAGEEAVSQGQSVMCHVFIFSRKSTVRTDPRHGLRSLRCPGCGAPPSGSAQSSCEYCGVPFNDGSVGWALAAIMPRVLWQRPGIQTAQRAIPGAAGVPAAQTPESDWAAVLTPAHGLAVMVGAMMLDGTIDKRELDFAKAYTRKHNIPDSRIDQYVQAAKLGQLQIPRPKSPAEARACMTGLIHMCLADGTVSAPEMRSLLAFGGQLGMTPDAVKSLAVAERDFLYRRAKQSLAERKN